MRQKEKVNNEYMTLFCDFRLPQPLLVDIGLLDETQNESFGIWTGIWTGISDHSLVMNRAQRLL